MCLVMNKTVLLSLSHLGPRNAHARMETFPHVTLYNDYKTWNALLKFIISKKPQSVSSGAQSNFRDARAHTVAHLKWSLLDFCVL